MVYHRKPLSLSGSECINRSMDAYKVIYGMLQVDFVLIGVTVDL